MASINQLPTNDLRSEAKEYQRDRNHNAKWARGFAPAVGKLCPHLSSNHQACGECATRPFSVERGCRHYKGPSTNAWAGKSNVARKAAFRNTVFDAADEVHGTSDSSAGEEDLREASAAPELDADIMYSFDAVTGPGKGANILSSAVSKAVERYENTVTEKIAKEYEFVEGGKDHVDGYTADADEDEFEMIDYAHVQ